MACQVCNGNNKVSLHFRATVCAACAAFFRRSVSEAKTFRCLRGQSCKVDLAVRNICRACRYAKCLSVGMDMVEVQPKRDAVSRTQQKRRQVPADQLNNKFFVPTPPAPQLEVSAHIRGQTAIAQQGTSKEERKTIGVKQCHRPAYLLDEVIDLYHKLLDRRKFMNSNFKSLRSLFMDKDQFELKEEFNKGSISRIKRKEMVLVADFMKSLRPISHFTPDEKFKMFKQFSAEFNYVEGCFITYMDDGLKSNSFTLGTGEKVSLDNVESFFERFATHSFDATTLKNLFQSVLVQGMTEVVAPMTAMKMTEREMLALCLIVLYSQTTVELPPEHQYALMKAKNEVVDDLHDFYCDNNEKDGEVRLGSVLLLVPSVMDWTKKKKEQYQLVRFFDMFTPEDSLSELYEND